MPIPAGAYDPTQAVIYRKVLDETQPEPTQVAQIYIRRHIRFPQVARLGIEMPLRNAMQSFGQIPIRMRRDSQTVSIDPAMEIHHDGTIYGIVSISPVPSTERDEIEFLCQYLNESRIVTG